jgi:hypothetical protein
MTKKELIDLIVGHGIKIPGGQAAIALDYFLDRPNRDVHHDDARPWINGECWTRLGEGCDDPDRAIRKLKDIGILVKVSKGVYRLDPEAITARSIEDFPEDIKAAAKERDQWRCVMCGRGEADGVELQVDHIRPRSAGGSGDLSNAQTLCGAHNYRKRHLSAYTAGRKMFETMREQARRNPDEDGESARLVKFCDEVLELFRIHGIEE